MIKTYEQDFNYFVAHLIMLLLFQNSVIAQT